MRINQATLHKIAQDTTAQRTRRDRSIVAVYLCGTCLGDDYLLGGTVDIDLAFIHADPVADEREIVRMTEDVHLDIAHYAQKDFRQTRKLRLHPWLGPTIYESKILYDPQHFMDFTQASVRGQFDRPDYVVGRARQMAEHARQIWFSFYSHLPEKPGAAEVLTYMRAIEHGANAVASLSGSPLTERRLLLKFPSRAEAAGRPGLGPALLGMLGGPHATSEDLRGWLTAWQAALEQLPAEAVPARLHPHRLPYYARAFNAMLDGGQPHALLWPLLRTWSLAVSQKSDLLDAQLHWRSALEQLGLLGAGFGERVEALDAFLDMVEETLEDWEQRNGV
jgi:hypothetical protein